MVYYPMSNGRAVYEPLRLVKAMQVSDAHEVATPESLQPGDKVIMPPAGSVDGAAADRAASDEYKCNDWTFCKKSL